MAVLNRCSLQEIGFFTVVGILAVSSLDAQEPPQETNVLKIDNGTASVGVDPAKGGAITWLSWKNHPENVVNIHDPGRLIQQSYYAGRRLDRTSEGQSPNWSPWAWNPIQGGGVSSWARVTRLRKLEDLTLYGETIPKLWDMPNEEAEAVMQQWTSFEPRMPNVIAVRNRIVCQRNPGDVWGPASVRPQEVPASYFVRSFDRFESYLGDRKWRDERQSPGPPWGKAEPPLSAMACFDDEGQGVAVYSPTSDEPWSFGPHGHPSSTDPNGGPCVHIAPIARVLIGPNSSYEYRYWLVVGDADQLAASLDKLIVRHSNETAILNHSVGDANNKDE